MSDEDEIVPLKSGIERAREERITRLRDLEDTILLRASNVVDAAMAWGEIECNTAEPPSAWIEAMGYGAAKQRLNVAKAAWMPQSQAPVGLKLAVAVQVGIAKARGQGKNAGVQNLNVQIVLPAPTSKEHPAEEVREVIDVDP